MIYILEQIKNFTPIERNAFIDEMIEFYKKNNLTYGIWLFFAHKTSYKSSSKSVEHYIYLSKIPCKPDIVYVIHSENRISFLKSIKTAE